jgi:cytochrome c553
MKIVLSAVVALFLLGCSEDTSSRNESKSVAPVKTEVVEKVAVVEEKTAPVEEKAAVAEEKAAPVEEKVAATEEKAAVVVDGAKLFVACSSCHGAHGEKKALGKSQVIQGWEATKTVAALKGYKDGTYGAAMKAVMKGQAGKLSDAEIDALAEYISKL